MNQCQGKTIGISYNGVLTESPMVTITVPNDTAKVLLRVLKSLRSSDSWIGSRWREHGTRREAVEIDRVIREMEAADA